MHDASADWASLIRDAGMSGWAVHSESIGADPGDRSGGNYTWLAAYGVTPIVRLNYSHHGEGTIPLPDRYDAFAVRCANFVTASSGCTHWIIGNEPNLAGERCQGVPITARQYVDCYKRCRNMIKQRGLQHLVYPAAVAPYNVDTGWCMDYWHEMLSLLALNQSGDAGADGLTIHTYSRGANPESIYSEDKMDYPYDQWRNGFRAYKDFLGLVPASMRGLPVYITETDQNVRWKDANSGWVRNAYQEIDAWNHAASNQKISCLCLYRWENHDQWVISTKNGVIDDFKAAVRRGYQAPAPSPIPEPPQPWPPDPQPEPPMPTPEPDIEWDPRLSLRGCELTVAEAAAGQTVWRCVSGEWFNQEQAQNRINTFVTVLDENEQLLTGVPITWYWQSGEDTQPSEVKHDPWLGHPYSKDFGMYNVAPSYGIRIADGNPTDVLWGMGLGSIAQPDYKIHTSYAFVFQRVRAERPVPPIPPIEPPIKPPVERELVHPLPGAVITQNFYEESDAYEQYGFRAHNGTDLGGRPLRTPVRSMASGIVAFADFDAGYGHYVRMDYRDLDAYVMYCHLDEPGATAGTRLQAGDMVGLLGSSGNSTGAHLHLEARLQNKDGTYREDTPMSKGRIDIRTWAAMYGLKI